MSTHRLLWVSNPKELITTNSPIQIIIFLESINLMLQKEKINLKYPDNKVHTVYQIVTALDNTFVVDANFYRPEEGVPPTRKIIHQTVEGKELLQLYNRGSSKKRLRQPFQMMNDRQVMILLRTPGVIEIQVINLQSRHISRSFLDKQKFEQKLQQQSWWDLQHVYLFPQTQLVSIVGKEYDDRYVRVLYYKYNQLQEGKAKPAKWYTFQGQNMEATKVNDCSKMAVWKLDGSTITSLTFFNQKEELATLNNLRCSWFDSLLNENINKDQQIFKMNLIECRPEYYFLSIYSLYDGRKSGFLDTSKQTQISKQLLIQTEGRKQDIMFLQPLKNTIVFYDQFRRNIHTYFFDYQQQTMVAADHQESGVESWQEMFFFPNWDRNTIVRVQKKNRPAEDIGVTVIRLISRFPLTEVSMHMLLHLNEDFDDDLLMDSIELL